MASESGGAANMTSGVIDLDEVFRIWARNQYQKTVSWFRRINLQNAIFEVRWDRVRAKHQNQQDSSKGQDRSYEKLNVPESLSMQSKIVHESIYQNNTDSDQTNNYKTEQKTTSTAIIKLTKGFIRSAKIGIELPLPPERDLREPAKVIGSFGTCFSIGSTEESKVEKTLKWSADSAIKSERQKMTVAKLEVQFTHESFTFNTGVQLKGRTIINIRDRRDPSKVVNTIEGDVATVIFDMQKDGGYDSLLGSATVDPERGVVTWPFSGSVELSYGISQMVNVMTKPLPENMLTKETQATWNYELDGWD